MTKLEYYLINFDGRETVVKLDKDMLINMAKIAADECKAFSFKSVSLSITVMDMESELGIELW